MQNRSASSLAVAVAGEAATSNLTAACAGVTDSQTQVHDLMLSAEMAEHGTAALSEAARAASSPGFPGGRGAIPSTTKQTIEIWPQAERGRKKGSGLDR